MYTGTAKAVVKVVVNYAMVIYMDPCLLMSPDTNCQIIEINVPEQVNSCTGQTMVSELLATPLHDK